MFKCLLCLSRIYLHICVFPLVDVCHWQHYQNLSDAERKYDYATVNQKCDDTLNGWYRFQGAAGTKMVTTCPPMDRCDTAYPIWLSGGHKTVAEGTVPRKFCIHKSEDCCFTWFFIQAKNCSSYYIYKLYNLKHCPFRYKCPYCKTETLSDSCIRLLSFVFFSLRLLTGPGTRKTSKWR